MTRNYELLTTIFALVSMNFITPVICQSVPAIQNNQFNLHEAIAFPRKMQFLEDCYISYIDCMSQYDESSTSLDVDVTCSYNIEPGEGAYETVIYALDENGECTLQNSEIAPQFISVKDPSGNGENGEFTADVMIDRAMLAEALATDPDMESFSFCIRNDIIVKDFEGNEVKLAPHLTKVDIGVAFDGMFMETILLESTVTVDEYSVATQYSVSSYLCDVNAPHDAIDPTTEYSATGVLSICVITDEEDTVIQKIEDFTLIQYNEAGGVEHQFVHIQDGTTSGISLYDCTQLKPGSTTPASMCVIQAKLTSPFFQNPDLGLKAIGEAGLRINPEAEGRTRQLQTGGEEYIKNKKGAISVDGSVDIQIPLSRVTMDIVSSGVLIGRMRSIMIGLGVAIALSL